MVVVCRWMLWAVEGEMVCACRCATSPTHVLFESLCLSDRYFNAGRGNVRSHEATKGTKSTLFILVPLCLGVRQLQRLEIRVSHEATKGTKGTLFSLVPLWLGVRQSCGAVSTQPRKFGDPDG